MNRASANCRGSCRRLMTSRPLLITRLGRTRPCRSRKRYPLSRRLKGSLTASRSCSNETVRPNCFGFRKIAMMASYIAPAMIGLSLTLALAIRAVVCAIGAVASVAKRAGDGRLEAVRARPAAFPCSFPARPAAGKIFSLPTGTVNLAQAIDITSKFRFNRADFGAETKNFPAFSPVGREDRGGGVRTCPSRGCRPPGRDRPARACRSGRAGSPSCRRPRCRSGRRGRSARPGIRR